MLLLVAVPEARSDSGGSGSAPAVKALNARVGAGYNFASFERGTATNGTRAPETDVGQWNLGGAVTAPLGHRFGARGFLSGGIATIDTEDLSGVAGRSADVGSVSPGAVVFWRNPERGHADVGYRFEWNDPSELGLDSLNVHSLLTSAGLFLPDSGIGATDLDLSFTYARANAELGIASAPSNEFAVAGAVALYPTDWLYLSGGASWSKFDPDIGVESSTLLGRASIVVLPPIGARRVATLSVFGSGGRRESSRFSGPIDTLDQTVWSIGGTVTLYYPGAASLRELFREYR